MPFEDDELQDAADLDLAEEEGRYATETDDRGATLLAYQSLWYYIEGLKIYPVIQSKAEVLATDFRIHWSEIIDDDVDIRYAQFGNRMKALAKEALVATKRGEDKKQKF